MARFVINSQELREILDMVVYDREMCLEEGFDFSGLYLSIGSDKAIISFISDECGIMPWVVSLEAVEDKDESIDDIGYYLEDWAVLELAKVLKEANSNAKVIIDAKNEKLLVEDPGKTIEYKLW